MQIITKEINKFARLRVAEAKLYVLPQDLQDALLEGFVFEEVIETNLDPWSTTTGIVEWESREPLTNLPPQP